MPEYSPIEVAIALARYAYNVDAETRAWRLYAHFDGACAEVHELARILLSDRGFAATELAFPTAEVYVQHALEEYGAEAAEVVRLNRLDVGDVIRELGKGPAE